MIGKTISHYKILEKIGEGGMGVVYKAEDTKLQRHVALKFLPMELTRDAEAKQRFIQEAQAAAALDHPNICTIYEIGEAKPSPGEAGEGQTFISMAYIEGQSLKERIKSGPPKVGEALDIAVQVAEGIKEAHEKGIIHRDIKPGNIMLTEKGQAKIMDFGLAKIEWGPDLTKTATIMGTVAYMSPEQARGEAVDHRTDIWSFGAMLYEWLTGKRPFKSHLDQAAIYEILHEEPQPITRLRKELPLELEDIVKKSLKKNPAERYQKVNDILTDLKSLRKKMEEGAAEKRPKELKPSIVVMPFVDMSPQKDQEYFCDGIAEELISALSHVKDMHVVARTSAFSFKDEKLDVREIGRRLNVKTVLEGSIRKAGNRIRITAQLINVEDGFHLWSEKFDREMEDIFAIQDEISLSIVDSLKIKLLKREKAAIEKRHTDDPEAYNLYLKGLHFSSKPAPEAINKALEYYRKAIDRDPNFALPYAAMAYMYGSYAVLSFMAPLDVFPKARAAFEKALEIDDSLAEAHAQAALIAFWFEWDWKAAESHFKKALTLNPGMALCHAWYAWYHLAMGRFDEAISEIKKSQELDPLLSVPYAMSVRIHRDAGRLDETMDEFQKAIELDPNSGLAYFHMGTAYLDIGMEEEAFSFLKRSLELAPFSGWAEAGLAHIYIRQKKREDAEKILGEILERKKKMYVSSLSIALIYKDLGESDKAFEFLDKAYDERDSLMPYINVFSEMHGFRPDPRFRALLKKMGF